ncbi:MAG: hypothetical protein K8Q92_03730 [Methylophilales bacterium]|nr:hypothetical protein [Methylophilales bacterium]
MRLILILLLALPTITIAEDARLGRLFLTPSDRATLDIVRKNSKAPDKVITSKDIEQEAVTEDAPVVSKKASSPVIVNGYISRSDGKNTVWVNDRPMAEKSTSQTVKVEKLRADKGQVKIVLTDEKKAASLRPGQVYDPNSNRVYNNLRDVPRIEPEQESENVVDKISAKLGEGVDELKKKASALIDLLKPNSETTASAEK